MTEVQAPEGELTRGTAAHLMHFFDWAQDRGELPGSTVRNWRIASTKVLSIEDNWQDVNVVDFDLEAHISRFEILKRTAYSTNSMNAYKSRTRVGIEAYRMWLTGVGDWKPKSSGTKQNKNGSRKPAAVPVPLPLQHQKVETGGHIPSHAQLIEYPFVVRAGVRVVIALPEDLTAKEAKRVAKFVESLALDAAEEPPAK
jgi:hypothetical protein